ncbi:MAG: DUF6036 family nucleotidyltransferase [Bacteriovorax sp.]|nr:DUF6036 family nucleotidyltransferase [Bacteriovorax sp.]
MNPIEVVIKFDQYLHKNSMHFEAIVIGGAALSILGIITRQTQDVDVLDPEIPNNILEAAKLFATLEGISETSLKENWLNHGPESLRKYLRPNWRMRLQPLFQGSAITFTTLGRVDLIGTKILAYCDRGTDLKDCIDLKPSREEILEILPWVEQYDLNPDWPKYVRGQVEELASRLNYVL